MSDKPIDHIEPVAALVYMEQLRDHMNAPPMTSLGHRTAKPDPNAMSIAISMKRIADALCGTPDNSGMRHTLGDIADRMGGI